MATLIPADEAETRLKDPNNLLNRLKGELAKPSDYVETAEPEVEVNELKLHPGGRHEGDTNLDPKMQAMVGVMARMDTAKNVGEAFGVSRQQVHNLKHGRTTDKNGVNPRLAEDMQTKREAVADAGLKALIDSVKSFRIEEVTDNLKKLDAAVKLATIVDKMAPVEKQEKGGSAKITLNIYAPRTKDLEEYDVMEVVAEEVE